MRSPPGQPNLDNLNRAPADAACPNKIETKPQHRMPRRTRFNNHRTLIA